MKYLITIVLIALSYGAFAEAKHKTKECIEIISQIEGVLRDNQEFLSNPSIEVAKNLVGGLHDDHKVLYVCGTDCFQDQPEINRVVADIGSTEFMLVKSIERWLNPKYEMIQEVIHEQTVKRMQSLLMSIESFNKSIQPTPVATAD